MAAAVTSRQRYRGISSTPRTNTQRWPVLHGIISDCSQVTKLVRRGVNGPMNFWRDFRRAEVSILGLLEPTRGSLYEPPLRCLAQICTGQRCASSRQLTLERARIQQLGSQESLGPRVGKGLTGRRESWWRRACSPTVIGSADRTVSRISCCTPPAMLAILLAMSREIRSVVAVQRLELRQPNTWLYVERARRSC